MKTIDAAIEHLYRTFAGYLLPAYTDPCRCCHTPEQEEKLHEKPLRELSASDLSHYAFDALLTWGSATVFKHLLPRVFELYFITPQDPQFAISPEILFSKFRYAKWHEWPANEQEAVRSLLQAVWLAFLAAPDSPPFYEDPDAGLCTIAQCEDDLGLYFDQWLETETLHSDQLLAQFLISGWAGTDAFWDNRIAQKEQLIAWQHSTAVIEALTNAKARYGPEYSAEFDAALMAAKDSEA
jgi:hypothetical protein